jgi:hypothetical protein
VVVLLQPRFEYIDRVDACPSCHPADSSGNELWWPASVVVVVVMGVLGCWVVVVKIVAIGIVVCRG